MRRLVAAGGLHLGRGGDPEGPPVVFVHGAMDRGTAFLRTTRRLGDTAWWTYDRRGYGRSRWPEATELDGHVVDLGRVLDLATDDGARPAVVVGHSLGGTVALAGAERWPGSVASVVAYESPLSWLDWWPRRGPGGGVALEDEEPDVAVDRFMRRVVGERTWASLPEATRRRRTEEGVTLVAELASVRREAPFDTGAVAAPVVVAVGSTADEHRARAAAVLVEQLPAAELVELDGAGHGAHLSHPGPFADLVRLALERAGTAAGPPL